MKIRVTRTKPDIPHNNDAIPVTKEWTPISSKKVRLGDTNYIITIDLGKIGVYFARWKYQDYYSRKVPKK